MAGLALHHLGRPDEGDAELRRIEDGHLGSWGSVAAGLASVRAGEPSRARDLVAAVEVDGSSFKAGVLHAALGDEDRAVAAMGRAAPLVWDDALVLRYFRCEPLADLRRTPGFRALLRDLDRSWGMGEVGVT